MPTTQTRPPSKVYFTNLSTRQGKSLPQKLQHLIKKAGIGKIDFDGKFVAVKLHFGEMGNLAYLRPNYAKALCDHIKTLGAKPFVTDCNTLYVGSRKNALDHLDCAYENGYNPFATGVHTIIADGLKGTDEVLVPVENGEYVTYAKIGTAIMDADIFISLNHFKGHEMAGFGGAIKNIGMGSGSRAGKMEMHSSGKPHVDQSLCIGCRKCAQICAHDAVAIENKLASIEEDVCKGCGRCIGACPKDAVCPASDEANDIMNYKMAEYSKAVLSGREHFHINLVIDISPFCDCHSKNDVPIVPDVGFFASFDPVALDRACADAVNRQTPHAGSLLEHAPDAHSDHFCNLFPGTNWETQLTHSEKLGIGTEKYTLIEC